MAVASCRDDSDEGLTLRKTQLSLMLSVSFISLFPPHGLFEVNSAPH